MTSIGWRVASIAIVSLAALFLSAAQYSSSRCGPFNPEIDNRLRESANEMLAYQGVTDDGGVFRLYASPSPADTFTVVTVRPGDLMACMVATGYALQKTPNGRNL